MRWADHVANVGEKKRTLSFIIGEPENNKTNAGT
jgi:hypothetical protein